MRLSYGGVPDVCFLDRGKAGGHILSVLPCRVDPPQASDFYAVSFPHQMKKLARRQQQQQQDQQNTQRLSSGKLLAFPASPRCGLSLSHLGPSADALCIPSHDCFM